MIYLQSIFVQFNVDQYIWNHMFSCAVTHVLIKIEILNWKLLILYFFFPKLDPKLRNKLCLKGKAK